MQTAYSRLWTRIAGFISNYENLENKNASLQYQVSRIKSYLVGGRDKYHLPVVSSVKNQVLSGGRQRQIPPPCSIKSQELNLVWWVAETNSASLQYQMSRIKSYLVGGRDKYRPPHCSIRNIPIA